MIKKFLGTVIFPGNYDPATVCHMNALRYLSERSDKVYAVIMTPSEEEPRRWISSEVMKGLIENALDAMRLNNVFVYIEKDGWLAHSIEKLNADGVARCFHAYVENSVQEKELIESVTALNVPVHLLPCRLELRSSQLRWLSEEGLIDDFKDQLPESVYLYIKNNNPVSFRQ